MSRKSIRSSTQAFTHIEKDRAEKDRGSRKERRQFRASAQSTVSFGSMTARDAVAPSPFSDRRADPASTSQLHILADHLSKPSGDSAPGWITDQHETTPETLVAEIPGKIRGHVPNRVMSLVRKPLSVLLASAAYGGTLAAARQLGSADIQVGILKTPVLSPAAWSNRSLRSYSAPAEGDTAAFLKRLLEIGAANPGNILLPTSDEIAWLYTKHSDQLKRFFYVNQPPVATMRRILDKKLFADAVSAAGLAVLPTWEPRSLEHVSQLAASLPYPVLIKPRTHVQRLRNDKGLVVHSKGELIEQFQAVVDRERQNDATRNSSLPVLQEFVDVAKEGVCSVSGYIDRTGDLFVTRRTTKVLQRSQPVGVGVCFEALPPDPVLSESVRRLCRELGYFGMFEVEFLKSNAGWAPIDFNGRLFNQIGLDIRRKMPLPLFACLEAVGDIHGLRAAIAKAQSEDTDHTSVFYDRFTLNAILTARRLTGRISSQEHAHWRAWTKKHSGHTVDVATDSRDPMPGIIHAVSEICLGLRAFPRFLQSIPKVSSAVASAMVKVHQ